MSFHQPDQPLQIAPRQGQVSPSALYDLNSADEIPLSTRARIYINAIDRAALASVGDPHTLLTVPVVEDDVTSYVRVCSCGWISLPIYRLADVAVTTCDAAEVEALRIARARSRHGVRARMVLVGLLPR